MNMDKDQVSPVGIVLTLLIHFFLLYLAFVAQFTHHQLPRDATRITYVSIPVDTTFHPHPSPTPSLKDLLVPDQQLLTPDDNAIHVDQERYYRQSELSQNTHALLPQTQWIGVPIRQPVVVTIYVNEAGDMDAITIDDPGDLTDEEKQKLIERFRLMQFLPGMRGNKIVKSIYRMQLQVNQTLKIQR